VSEPGRVVILNGASSAGKTTLAERFRDLRATEGDCWIIVGLDDFTAMLPWQWFDTPQVNGPQGQHGIRFELSAEGLVLAVGAVGRRLFRVYRRSVATWARAGFNVIVDEVAFSQEAVRDWADALAGLTVTWVGVRCHPDVAEARERERGDRDPGLARGLTAVVHQFATYDFELDATTSISEDLAVELSALLDERRAVS